MHFKPSLAFALLLLLGSPSAHANVMLATLQVRLNNPGVTVSSMTFMLISGRNGFPNAAIQGISVTSTPNLFPPGVGAVTIGTPIEISGNAMNLTTLVPVTLNPIRAWRQNRDPVQFTLTLPNVNGIRINTTVERRADNSIVTDKPRWFDNASPPAEIMPSPTLPGFMVNAVDADFTLYNDSSDPFGVQNLTFLPVLTPAELASLDLAAIEAAPDDPSLPSLPTSFSEMSYPNLPNPSPGDFFVAEGQLTDSSGDVIGAFIAGVQVSEPPIGILAIVPAGMLVGLMHRRAQSGPSTPPRKAHPVPL